MDKQKKRRYNKEYYQKHKEELVRKNIEYRENNIKKYKEYQKEYARRPEVKKRKKEYHQKHEEKIKRYSKKYNKKYQKEHYQKNKERISKKQKEHIQRPEIKEKRREYYQKPEVKMKAREYFQNHKKQINERLKKKLRFNKNFNIRMRLGNILRQALRIYTKTGKVKTSKKYGIDWQVIIEYLKPFPKDLLEKKGKWHIDHIRPLCSFDLTNPEEIKIAFAPENHQWLLAHENMSKGGRYE